MAKRMEYGNGKLVKRMNHLCPPWSKIAQLSFAKQRVGQLILLDTDLALTEVPPQK